MTKASDNLFPKIILSPLGAPSAPSDASWKLYPMADGIYARSSNTTVGPLGAGGSSLTVQDEGSPLATAATTLNFVGAGVAATGTGATKTITIAGGGSTELAPDLITSYNQANTNGTSHSHTITAAASGKRLVVVVGSYARDVNTPTCTNTTFTEVYAGNFSTTIYLSIYVGVVAGGSSGTSVTVTATGSNFIITDIYEIGDALTPTAGNSATVSNTDITTLRGKTIGRVACSIGNFYVVAAAQNDGSTSMGDVVTNNGRIFNGWRPGNSALTSGIGVASSTSVNGYFNGGTSGADGVAGIIVVT